MAGVKSKSGGRRKGAGRKTKSEEQGLIELLGPYESIAIANLAAAIEEGEPWAIKLFFQYRYGRPRQIQDITMGGTMEVTPISFFRNLPEWMND